MEVGQSRLMMKQCLRQAEELMLISLANGLRVWGLGLLDNQGCCKTGFRVVWFQPEGQVHGVRGSYRSIARAVCSCAKRLCPVLPIGA